MSEVSYILCQRHEHLGNCGLDDCPFAHPTNPKYKTERCIHFHNTGYCRLGDKCMFSHKDEETRKLTPDDIRQIKKDHRYRNTLCNLLQ